MTDDHNLYDDANDMLLASMLYYAIVDLRNMSRQDKLEKSELTDKLLELPISSLDILHILKDNEEVLNKELGVDEVGYRATLNDYIKSKPSDDSRININCMVCDDINQDTELIYGVWTSSAKSQIIVTFRGCTTIRDWTASGTTLLSEHVNPVSASKIYKATHPEKSVLIHRGFYDYLFNSTTKPKKGDSGDNNGSTASNDTRCVYDKIKSDVNRLLEENLNYQVYVTGHSLGAAITTIFSYFYAADDDKLTTLPIMCFPTASPMVGNLEFARSFSLLEKEGKIRCLRVTNHNDIFIQIPDRTMCNYLLGICCAWNPFSWIGYCCLTCCFSTACQKIVYRHVGINLHLYKKNGKYKFKYPHNQLNEFKNKRSSLGLIVKDWRKHMKQTGQRLITIPFVCCPNSCACKEDFNVNHGCKEYMNRLYNVSDSIKEKDLNTMYEEWKPAAKN